MSPAIVSLAALGGALVLSMTSRINVGWVAMAAAWIIGVYVAGMRPDAVMSGFPVSLFLTLAGVTLLFAIAETNGTLEILAHRSLALVRGRARLVPLLLFVIACTLSSVGPGAISAVALLIPLAIVVGDRAGLSPLLTSLMVTNGANAGNLSPVSSVGVIANSRMAEAGLPGHELKVWFASFAAHALVSIVAYLLFGHRKLTTVGETSEVVHEASLTGRQRLTVAVAMLWIAGVVLFKLSLGLSAFAGATILLAFSAAEESAAVKRVPWGVIMMVSGVTVLISILEKTGGMDLFTSLLARLASPETVNGVIAFVTGLISTWSSTSGVVLPSFLPTVPGLVEKVGGGDPLAVALSINVGSALVDVSPLSTLGALCVSAVASQTGQRKLFNRLMIWGLSMAVVGAVLCQVFAGALAEF
ncbi:MAG: SLC13 family permease [Gemmatimonadaceae bacterium]